MIPEQKAKSLIFDMEQRIEQQCNQSSRKAHYLAAKECAFIVVYEMLGLYVEPIHNSEESYWQQVKKELEKL